MNGTTPALNATNLNKITNELRSQATTQGIANTLPTWVNSVAPAISDATGLNEMERVARAVALSLSLSYTQTAWTVANPWPGSPARNATNLNKLEAQAQANRAAMDASIPPATGYVTEDWAGMIAYPPWSTIFSYTAPGYLDCGYYGYPPRTGSPEGRVSIVTNPYGTGKLLRIESRDSDPGWPVVPTLSKTEVSMVRETTWPNGVFSFGSVIWISFEMYLPNEFSLASGGSNPFTELCGLHPSSSSGISALEVAQQPSSNIRLHYGQVPNDQFVDLFPLDSAHRNRKITVVLGAKIDPSSSVGWAEAWVDGVQKLPRTTIATAASTESGPYWKQGFYTSADALYVGGSVPGTSVIYWGRTVLSQTRPF